MNQIQYDAVKYFKSKYWTQSATGKQIQIDVGTNLGERVLITREDIEQANRIGKFKEIFVNLSRHYIAIELETHEEVKDIFKNWKNVI